MHAFVRIVIEFPHFGGIDISAAVKSATFLFDFENGAILLGCEMFVFIASIYFVIRQLAKLVSYGFYDYFKRFWNWVITLMIITDLPCMYAYLYIMDFNEYLTDDELWDMQSWFEFREYLFAFSVFLSTLRLLKYVRFSLVLSELQKTLDNCYRDLIGFSFMFIAVMMAFAL
ncbi:hypothetical protein GJ496_003484 [Pomphorhynchus laevis]|nr:hypothetical protein GJ496_003484 [Pomphorhynchus laevis]